MGTGRHRFAAVGYQLPFAVDGLVQSNAHELQLPVGAQQCQRYRQPVRASQLSSFASALVSWCHRSTHSSRIFLLTVHNPFSFPCGSAYLFFDLLRGGPGLVIQSATGLLSAHVYYYLTAVLPNTDGGRGPRLLSTPAFLRRLFPDSVDPANAAANAERDRGAGGAGAGGRVMSTGWGGTAFAPRGRQFGDGGHEWGTAAGDQQSRSAGSSGGSWSSWLPSVLRGGDVGRQGQTASSTSGPSQRQALLEATERRLRAQRDNSIAGRNAAASSSSSSSRPAAAAAPTPTMAGRPTTGTTGVRTGDSSESTLRSRTHGSANLGRLSNPRDRADDDEEEELDASSSGGAVAEERRPEDRKAAAAASNRAGSGANPPPSTEGRGGQQEQGHSWGQGQRLGE